MFNCSMTASSPPRSASLLILSTNSSLSKRLQFNSFSYGSKSVHLLKDKYIVIFLTVSHFYGNSQMKFVRLGIDLKSGSGIKIGEKRKWGHLLWNTESTGRQGTASV